MRVTKTAFPLLLAGSAYYLLLASSRRLGLRDSSRWWPPKCPLPGLGQAASGRVASLILSLEPRKKAKDGYTMQVTATNVGF